MQLINNELLINEDLWICVRSRGEKRLQWLSLLYNARFCKGINNNSYIYNIIVIESTRRHSFSHHAPVTYTMDLLQFKRFGFFQLLFIRFQYLIPRLLLQILQNFLVHKTFLFNSISSLLPHEHCYIDCEIPCIMFILYLCIRFIDYGINIFTNLSLWYHFIIFLKKLRK